MFTHRTSSRHHQESSDGASMFEGLASASDLPVVVFNYAPFWWWSCNWWCKHPDSKEEQSHITIAGPFSSEEMHQLYRNRQMKGSNLVVGLTSSLPVPSQDSVPAAYFRTLAYLFELAKAGSTYTPITPADLARGARDASWCRPLWGSFPQGDASQQRTPASGGAGDAPAAQLSTLALASEAGLAEKLLSSAPWWCYLYSHEPAKEPGKETAKAKKTPPKTAEQMLQYYRDRCLPDWTPVLGLDKSVATFNALPPCLFMPLGSLMHLMAAGGRYQALNDTELQAWDKFSDTRNPTTGSTMGGGGGGGATAGPPSHALTRSSSSLMTRHSTGSQPYPVQTPQGAWPVAVHQPQPAQSSAFVQFPQPQAPMAYPPSQFAAAPAPGMMWMVPGGGAYAAAAPFASSQLYRQPGPTVLPPPMAGPDPGPERSSDVGPVRNAERVFRTQLSCPTPAHTAGLVRQDSRGLDRPALSYPMSRPLGSRWSTAVFRLFTADATREHAEAVWYYTLPSDAQVFGPCTDEQMIILYLRGQISDEHFACGLMADAGKCPPISQFERIGAIMSGVEGGGEYHLLSAADVSSLMGPPDGPERYERHSYTGPHSSAAEAARRRGKAAAPVPPRTGSSLGTRQMSGTPADQAAGRW